MKNLVRMTMAMALLVPIGLASAAPAGAAALLTCKPPSGKLAITPGLGPTAKVQTVIISLPVAGCKGTAGITSGVSKGKSVGKKALTCSQFLADPSSTSITDTITWNNKKSTTFKATTTAKIVGGALQATISGKVTAGLFLGKNVSTKVGVTLNGKCTTVIKSITIKGLSNLTIG